MAEEKSVDELYNDIDINFVNHNIMFWGKTPAFALFFALLFMLPLLIASTLSYVVTTIIFIVLYRGSKAIHLEGYHSPAIFLDIIKYIYKPKFYIIKKKDEVSVDD